MGRKLVSMTPSFHLKVGSNQASQGYPKIASSIPRSVIRNLILAVSWLTWTLRSTKSVIIPALLLVPSIFQIFQGSPSFWVPNLKCFTVLGSMKLSVAPESTNRILLALLYAVRNETGTFILCFLVRYTVLHSSIQIALPQANGFELRQNPA